MNRTRDDDEEDEIDDEGPDARDLRDDAGNDDDPDATDTMACPHCDAAVYAGAERCPACGEYITDEAIATRSMPLWVTLTVVLCIILMVLTMVL